MLFRDRVDRSGLEGCAGGGKLIETQLGPECRGNGKGLEQFANNQIVNERMIASFTGQGRT